MLSTWHSQPRMCEWYWTPESPWSYTDEATGIVYRPCGDPLGKVRWDASERVDRLLKRQGFKLKFDSSNGSGVLASYEPRQIEAGDLAKLAKALVKMGFRIDFRRPNLFHFAGDNPEYPISYLVVEFVPQADGLIRARKLVYNTNEGRYSATMADNFFKDDWDWNAKSRRPVTPPMEVPLP